MINREENEEVRRGRGRPKKIDTCGTMHTARLNEDDESKLNSIMIEDGDSASDIIRKALRLYYNFRSRNW